MKIKLSIPIKNYRVASSRRNPDTGEILCYWTITLENDGSLYCNCPAGSFRQECRHKTRVRKFIQRYEPEKILKPPKKNRNKS